MLAIGKRLGEAGTTGAAPDPNAPAGQGFEGGTIATLEVNPGQAETLVNSASLGKLSLALRSIVDFPEAQTATGRPARRQTQAIRVIRYGREASVTAANAAAPATTTTTTTSVVSEGPVPSRTVPTNPLVPTTQLDRPGWAFPLLPSLSFPLNP